MTTNGAVFTVLEEDAVYTKGESNIILDIRIRYDVLTANYFSFRTSLYTNRVRVIKISFTINQYR